MKSLVDRDVPFPDAEACFRPGCLAAAAWQRAKAAGHEEMLAARAAEPRKTPPWVNELARRGHEQRLEQARALVNADVWLWSGDERTLDIKSLVNEMPIEELPGYTPQRRDAALAFWQSWQNAETGRFYNPAVTDPQDPADPSDFCNEKYAYGTILALGGDPLYPHVTAAPPTAPASQIDPDYVLDFCANDPTWADGGWHAGSWAGAMVLELMNAIEAGDESLLPTLREAVRLVMSHQNPETGVWGEPDAALEIGLSGALKVLMRFHYYLGMQGLPYMDRLADTLILHQERWLPGPDVNDCYPRNAAELMAICIEVSDYRRDELFLALDTLAQRYECLADATRTQTHEHGLGILAGYLNWADCLLYNPKAWLPRGAAYSFRVQMDPAGDVQIVNVRDSA